MAQESMPSVHKLNLNLQETGSRIERLSARVKGEEELNLN